jgi:hypothetical protein
LFEQTVATANQFLHDKQIAEDRLYAAFKEGYQIPPRQSVEAPQPKEIRILPDKLHAFVNNWEGADTRAELEAEARRLHFEMGLPEDRVLQLFEQRNGDGAPSE